LHSSSTDEAEEMVIWGRARSAGAGGKGAPPEEAEERPLSAETAGLRL
jgi:hypothetical protein